MHRETIGWLIAQVCSSPTKPTYSRTVLCARSEEVKEQDSYREVGQRVTRRSNRDGQLASPLCLSNADSFSYSICFDMYRSLRDTNVADRENTEPRNKNICRLWALVILKFHQFHANAHFPFFHDCTSCTLWLRFLLVKGYYFIPKLEPVTWCSLETRYFNI